MGGVMESPRPSRTYQWASPEEIGQARKGLSGIDYLRAQMTGACPVGAMSSTMGWSFDSVEPGTVRLRLVVAEFLLQGGGKLHGGAIAALFDSALACAVVSTLPADKGCLTTDLSSRFIKGVPRSLESVVAEGRALHVGRTTAVAEARLLDDERQVYAIASANFVVLQR
jgi:uncharacterized protein (TIGR00369 family)